MAGIGIAWVECMGTDPRIKNGNARRKLRAWLKAQGYPCALCGQPINYGLPIGHPDSFEVDEVVPVSRYWLKAYNKQAGAWAGAYQTPQQAALDANNVQATHRKCNEEKSNHIVVQASDQRIYSSRRW